MKFVRFARHEAVGHIILSYPPMHLLYTTFCDHLRGSARGQ
jgi:hypothetical protein